MVLTNSGSLFQNQGLLNEDGNLSERWGQPGSEVVNIKASVSSDTTVHTVSSNKILYVTQIIVQTLQNGSAGDYFDVRDDTATSGTKLSVYVETTSNNDILVYTFPTPLKFETSVYIAEAGSIDVELSIVGWEE